MAKKNQSPPPPPPKKCDADCPEGLPEWMATFSDMVTLLLCFFILLLSFAKQDINTFKTLMGSVKDAFGVQIKRKDAPYAAFSPTNYERKDVELSQQNKQILGLVLQLKNVLDDPKLKKVTKVTADDDGVVLRVDMSEMFDPGSAHLKPSAEAIFARVIKILKEYNFNVVVRGHTDDQPPNNAQYPTNWELSSARAAAALRYVMEHGEIPPTRLKAVGYADSQPLLPNTSDKNREANRRMEFYFHRPEAQSW
ncbi:MAG: OmpA family protein [Desulfovibrionaceae bacterium]|jgi:chemotaxis protein MotB|nr:OmpA family protein [Desulfovibrionaceae bacterium]